MKSSSTVDYLNNANFFLTYVLSVNQWIEMMNGSQKKYRFQLRKSEQKCLAKSQEDLC